MRNILLVAVIVAGCIVGSVAGAALALNSDEPTGEAAGLTVSLVDVKACPGGEGAVGQIKRGMPILVTARGPDGAYLEISYPLSPNGRGWLPATEVEAGEDIVKLPQRGCLRIIPSVSQTPDATASPTPIVTLTASATPVATLPPATVIPLTAAVPAQPTQAAPKATAITVPATTVPAATATPADSQPPQISQPSITPNQINGPNLQQNCPPRAAVVSVSANAADNIGVTQMFVRHSLATAAGATQTAMTLSQNRYSAVAGPFDPGQTTLVTFTIVARDLAGNEQTLQAGSVTVNDCK